MKWLLRRLRKSRPDPLALLRQAPSDAEREVLAAERFELDVLDALRDGEHRLSGFSNCAPGTRGYTLHFLVERGLMNVRQVSRLDGGVWSFAPTSAGLSYLGEREGV